MLVRVEVVVALVALAFTVALVVRSVVFRRVAAVEGRSLPERLRSRLADDGPGIIYFYGPRCPTCQQQASILNRLSAASGVRVVRVDASRETDLADALAVATVPTTVVFASPGRIRHVNLGFRAESVLAAQLGDASL